MCLHTHARMYHSTLCNCNIMLCFTELSNNTSARKAAAELNKVRDMYDNVCVLVEKDNAKKGDLSR